MLLMRGSLAGRLQRWTYGQTFRLTGPLFYHLFSQYLCSFFFYSVIHLFIHPFLFLPQLEELRHHVGSLEAEKAAIVKELSSLRFSRMTR